MEQLLYKVKKKNKSFEEFIVQLSLNGFNCISKTNRKFHTNYNLNFSQKLKIFDFIWKKKQQHNSIRILVECMLILLSPSMCNPYEIHILNDF